MNNKKNKKRKKSAFTLIELLAVILILGIIALIAIPSASKVIDSSKKGSFENTANNLAGQVKTVCTSKKIGGTFTPGTYKIIDGEVIGLDVEMNGKLPQNGEIRVDNNCQVAIYATDSSKTYYAVKNYVDERVTVCRIGEECQGLDDYNNLPISEPASKTCFTYENNSTGVTITGYKFDDSTCSRDIVIPTSIDEKNVTKLKEYAFVDKEKLFLVGKSIPNGLYKLSKNGGQMILDNNNLPILEGNDSATYNLFIYDKGSKVSKTFCYINSEKVFETEGRYDKTDSDGYDFCLYLIDRSETTPSNKNINSIDFSHAKYLKEIPFALANTSGLTSIKLGEYITKIGDQAFGFNSISSLTIPNSLKEIGSMAFVANDITSLDLNQVEKIGHGTFNNNEIDSLDFGALSYIPIMSFQNNILTNIEIPSSVTGIGGLAFGDCNASTVTIPGSVKEIGEGAFENQNGVPTITSITLGNGIEKIHEGAFATTNITSLTIPSSVKVIELGAFYNNKMLKTLTLNSGLEAIGSWAFQNDEALTKVVMPNTVTSLGEGAFYGCRELSSLTLSNKLTVIPKNAFYNSRISSLTIPSSIKRIEEGGFKCRYNSIKSITFNNGLEYIGKNAFNKSFNVATLTLPDSLKEIGASAFTECPNVKTINIGPNVTSIGSNAFQSMTSGTININKTSNSITGSPWGATSSTVNWLG